jgi:2',3'-cyclic-nucleotide 2'-phosphodiesterase/3'-nucleotidase/5'-nucleotidase
LKLAKLLLLFPLGACASAPSGPSAGGGGDPFDLVVLSTTDIHGRIRGWDYYADSAESGRGLTRAATIVDSIRSANPGRVILVDAGDLLQGNPFAYVALRQFGDSANPIIAAMNAMGYDAMGIGNHEYNYGVPYLERAVAEAKFAMLSANTYKPDGSHKFRPWTIVERQGVKIGIIGATTPGVMVWDAENVRGRVQLGDIVTAVRKAVGEVRAAGADVVVVTAHAGLDEPASYDTAATGLPSENVSRRMATEIPGIDLITYGHSHREQQDLHIGSTLLVQPKNWATSVGVARLSLARENGKWKVTSSKGQTIQARGHAEHPRIVAVSAATHQATVTYANTVIGTTPVAWRGDSARLKDTPLVDLIAEVQLKATGADLASTAAFTLDAKLDSGDITVAEIAQLYPYDNTLRAIRISGRQLRDYLEYSSRFYTGVAGGNPVTDPQVPGYNFDMVAGASYTLDITKPVGSRVTELTVKGKAVADTDSFTLALNNYRQSGGGGFSMIKDAPVVYDKQEEIRQLLIEEVQRRKTIRPEDYFKQNWILAYPNAPAVRVGGGTMASPGGARLRIIATNDLHGVLEPVPDANGVSRGGIAFVAATINKARSECVAPCHAILLDGGDLFQGTLASNLSFGRPVVEYYNRMGYTAAAVGNHEFDWGQDTLKARMRDAKFAFLAANARQTDGADVSWIRDDTLVTVGDTKVGIIGIAGSQTARSSFERNIRGLRFDDPAPIVDARTRALRSRGAGVVVLVAHDGGFCSQGGTAECRGEIFTLAAKLTEKVDAIVSGHTHSAVDYSVSGIPIVQARSRGQAVGIVDIPIAAGKPSGEASVEVRSVVSTEIAPDPAIATIVQRATAAVASRVNRQIGTLPEGLPRTGSQYPLGNLIADAQRVVGKGDIAVMNNGGIRQGLPAGAINYGHLFAVQPFENRLYRVDMTGAQLRAYLEQIVGRDGLREHVSGVTIGYNPELPKGQRIVSLRLPSGRTLSESATYSVVMNEFLALSGEGVTVPEGAVSVPLDIVDLDALISYLQARPGPIQAPKENRIFITQ